MNNKLLSAIFGALIATNALSAEAARLQDLVGKYSLVGSTERLQRVTCPGELTIDKNSKNDENCVELIPERSGKSTSVGSVFQGGVCENNFKVESRSPGKVDADVAGLVADSEARIGDIIPQNVRIYNYSRSEVTGIAQSMDFARFELYQMERDSTKFILRQLNLTPDQTKKNRVEISWFSSAIKPFDRERPLESYSILSDSGIKRCLYIRN